MEKLDLYDGIHVSSFNIFDTIYAILKYIIWQF